MRKSISWILDFTSKLPNEEEQIKCLRANGLDAIKIVLKYAFDPKIKWALPEGSVPYHPTEFKDVENVLYSEARKLYLFIEGGNPNLNQLKREKMFIEFMQTVDPMDAKMIESIKDKVFPYPGLSGETVLKAFPGLW